MTEVQVDLEGRVNKSIVLQMVKRQAAGPDRAGMEGVQNGLDACGTDPELHTIKVTITKTSLVVEDDGKGFGEEDFPYFLEVGFAHKQAEAEAAGVPAELRPAGEFDLGRLQLINLGLTTWRSRDVRLAYDFNTRGINPRATTGLPRVEKGTVCTVEFYKPLDDEEVQNCADTLRQSFYLGGALRRAVLINGRPVRQVKPDAIIKQMGNFAFVLREGGPKGAIYVKGIRVRQNAYTIPPYDVLSWSLKTNISRDQIEQDAEWDAFRKAARSIDVEFVNEWDARSSFPGDAVGTLLRMVKAGQVQKERAGKLRLFEGQGGSVQSIKQIADTYSSIIDVSRANAAETHMVGNRCSEAFIMPQISDEQRELLELCAPAKIQAPRDGQALGRDLIRVYGDEGMQVVELEGMNQRTRIIAEALQVLNSRVARRVCDQEPRRLVFAHLPSARGQTDCLSTVWLDVDLFKLNSRGGSLRAKLRKAIRTMVHEYCHRRSDLVGTDYTHGESFNRRLAEALQSDEMSQLDEDIELGAADIILS